MRMLAVFAFCLVISDNAHSKDAAALGAGTFTCGQFAADYKKNPSLAEGLFYTWAQGFMSGYNLAKLVSKAPSKNLSAKSQDEQKAQLRRFCNDNPLSDYGRAVFIMYDSLPDTRP